MLREQSTNGLRRDEDAARVLLMDVPRCRSCPHNCWLLSWGSFRCCHPLSHVIPDRSRQGWPSPTFTRQVWPPLGRRAARPTRFPTRHRPHLRAPRENAVRFGRELLSSIWIPSTVLVSLLCCTRPTSTDPLSYKGDAAALSADRRAVCSEHQLALAPADHGAGGPSGRPRRRLAGGPLRDPWRSGCGRP